MRKRRTGSPTWPRQTRIRPHREPQGQRGGCLDRGRGSCLLSWVRTSSMTTPTWPGEFDSGQEIAPSSPENYLAHISRAPCSVRRTSQKRRTILGQYDGGIIVSGPKACCHARPSPGRCATRVSTHVVPRVRSGWRPGPRRHAGAVRVPSPLKTPLIAAVCQPATPGRKGGEVEEHFEPIPWQAKGCMEVLMEVLNRMPLRPLDRHDRPRMQRRRERSSGGM